MNKKVLKTLEYNKIIDRLSDCACSELGKEKCRKLEPISDLNKIKKLQKETADALSLVWQKGSVSFSGLHDISASLKRLEIGSALGAGELLKISSLLKIALRIKHLHVKKIQMVNPTVLTNYLTALNLCQT